MLAYHIGQRSVGGVGRELEAVTKPIYARSAGTDDAQNGSGRCGFAHYPPVGLPIRNIHQLKHGGHSLPHDILDPKGLACRLLELADMLLYLVDEKGKQHQTRQRTQLILLAATVVVLVLLALVLQSIEGFIFHYPARSGGSHNLEGALPGDLQTGDPAHVQCHLSRVILVRLPVLNHVDSNVRV